MTQIKISMTRVQRLCTHLHNIILYKFVCVVFVARNWSTRGCCYRPRFHIWLSHFKTPNFKPTIRHKHTPMVGTRRKRMGWNKKITRTQKKRNFRNGSTMRHLPVSTSTRAHTRITYLRGLYVRTQTHLRSTVVTYQLHRVHNPHNSGV